MKFVRMTLNYFTLRKFLQLALVAAVPSIMLATTLTTSSISDFLINYHSMDLSSFGAIFNRVSDFRFSHITYYIVVIFIFVAGLSAMFGTVERDMRVGDFTLRGFFRRMNNNFFAVGLTAVLLMASILIMGVISAVLFFLWAFVAGGGLLSQFLSMLTALILFSLLILSWVNFLLLIPTMIITGQSTYRCMRDSIKHTQGIFMQLVMAITAPLFPVFLMIYVERAFGINIEFIVDVIINILLIVYYVVLMLVVHYEVTGLSREDLNPQSLYFR